jgi:uncharacterized protein with von Willebrand factor type A (vWA) domain
MVDLNQALAQLREQIGRRRSPDDLAYVVGGHHRYHWRALLEDSRVREVVGGWTTEESRWPAFGREVFARLYSGDELEEIDDAEPWAQRAHDLATELPEWSMMTAAAKGRRFESGMGAVALADAALQAYLAQQPDQSPQSSQPTEGAQNGPQGDDSSGGAQGTTDGENASQGPGQGKDGANGAISGGGQPAGREDPPEGQLRGAMRSALASAVHDAHEIDDAIGALAWGTGPGSARQIDGAEREKLAQLLAKNYRLRRIILEAGRLLRSAASKRSTSVDHVPEQVADITLGDDVAHLLPSELLLLCDEDTEILLLAKLAEKRALQYQLEGREPADQGPVIVCLDASGSMSSEGRMDWAAALAIAVCQQATREGRPAVVIPFHTRPQATIGFSAERGMLAQAVLSVARISPDGGTNFAWPLNDARGLIEKSGEYKHADILLVTDGACRVDPDWLTGFAAWRERSGVSLYGMAIRTNRTEVLESLCDSVDHVHDLVGDDRRAEVVNRITRR